MPELQRRALFGGWGAAVRHVRCGYVLRKQRHCGVHCLLSRLILGYHRGAAVERLRELYSWGILGGRRSKLLILPRWRVRLEQRFRQLQRLRPGALLGGCGGDCFHYVFRLPRRLVLRPRGRALRVLQCGNIRSLAEGGKLHGLRHGYVWDLFWRRGLCALCCWHFLDHNRREHFGHMPGVRLGALPGKQRRQRLPGLPSWPIRDQSCSRELHRLPRGDIRRSRQQRALRRIEHLHQRL